MKIRDYHIERIVHKHGKDVLKDEARLRNLLCDYNPYESVSLDDVREYLHGEKHQNAIQVFLGNITKPKTEPEPTSILPKHVAPKKVVQTGFRAGSCNLNPIAVSIDTSKPNKDFK